MSWNKIGGCKASWLRYIKGLLRGKIKINWSFVQLPTLSRFLRNLSYEGKCGRT